MYSIKNPRAAEALCHETNAQVGTRALGCDQLHLGMLYSFLPLLSLIHSQLKLDGGGQRKDLTPESTSYELLL